MRPSRARTTFAASIYAYFCRGPHGERQLQALPSRIASSSADVDTALEPTTIIEVRLVLDRHPGTLAAQVAGPLQGHSPAILLRVV